MSIKDYEGGIITKNPTTPTGPFQDGAASGVWTMDEAAEYTKQGVWPTAGNVNPEQYVEGVFSTYLYTGTGSALNIVNNIDLAAKGGLVWTKRRTSANSNWFLDSVRGGDQIIRSNTSDAQFTSAGLEITSFNSDGYTLGTASDINSASQDDVSWTFLKKPGFFDIVTYTGTGSATTISHNLGTVPGVMIIKRTSDVESWQVYHRDFATDEYIQLNSTAAATTVNGTLRWNNTRPTATEFSIGTHNSVNGSGDTYVAYLFAHDAQLFGDNANESIIKCGSFTNDSASVGVEVNLGWEPQWLLIKGSSSGSGLGNWVLIDNMRGASVDSQQRLYANATTAEGSSNWFKFTSRGFTPNTTFGGTLIYIAIRRPMMTPEAATEVFTPIARTGTGATAEVTGVGFAPDMLLQARRTAPDWPTSDRVRGVDKNLGTPYTSAENTPSPAYIESYDMDGVTLGSGNAVNGSGLTYIEYFFKRAPGFFDVVAYTGTGSQKDESHNLGVTPELMIVKSRSNAGKWSVYESGLGIGTSNGLALNQNSGTDFNNTTLWVQAPTSSVFTLGTNTDTNGSGYTYIAYLFASLAGISKVGSYTGTGSNVDVDCGFTSGARFVLIKRAAGIGLTGDWYVYDSVRGIVSGNDPFLLINTTDAENTSTDYIDPLSSGFTVTSSAPTALNNSGDNYIFLAIA